MRQNTCKGSALKYLIVFWGIPVGLLAVWHVLSMNDINFGLFFLSREFNDTYFGIYSQITGVEVDAIRASLPRILLVDTVFVFAVVYFKPFSRLRNWWKNYRASKQEQKEAETQFQSPYDVLENAQDAVLSPVSENNLSRAP